MDYVREALEYIAKQVVSIPIYKRFYGKDSKFYLLENQLNAMLPLGWYGYVSSNSISAHYVPPDANPNITGEPVKVLVRRIWLTGDDFSILESVTEDYYFKYPSWCCGWCGTDLRGQEQYIGPAGECPICGGN